MGPSVAFNLLPSSMSRDGKYLLICDFNCSIISTFFDLAPTELLNQLRYLKHDTPNHSKDEEGIVGDFP